MKVIISTRAIYPFHGFGGMERYYYNLAKHLVREDIEVEIITNSDKISKLETSEYDGIKFWFLPITYVKRLPMIIWYKIFNIHVKKFLEKYDFDILHGTAGTHAYSSLKNRRPVIHQPFGLELFKTKGIMKIYCYAAYYHMNTCMHKNADAIASEGEIQTKEIVQLFGVPKEKIKRLTRRLSLEDKVKHFKNIPDKLMFQLYTLADISVTPTLYEGLPLVVLEAMACEKPIVASNVSEVPQAVKDGINGFLVPPRNPKAIADAVLKIYDKNLFMKMGKASKKIVKNYDWSRIAKMAIKKYEELIGK